MTIRKTVESEERRQKGGRVPARDVVRARGLSRGGDLRRA